MPSRLNLTRLLCLVILFGFAPGESRCLNAQNVAGYDTIPEPLLFLVREPAVHTELKLDARQLRDLMNLNQSFDAELLASRLWPAEKSSSRFAEILATTRQHLDSKLNTKQRERLQQIIYRTRGIGFVLMPEVVEALKLSDDQQAEIRQTLDDTRQKTESLRKEVAEGTRRANEAEQKSRELQTKQQRDIFGQLTPEQQQQAIELIGTAFDLQQLGKVSFRAPEVIDTATWINSKPISLAGLKGQVVALHFWAFGCHNCIQNYPWYKQWYDAYDGKGLVILGVHTPETSTERQLDRVKAKVAEEKFRFPIVVDNDSENWKAWGNSMWPSVYLIDKQGRVRYWWYGELNWQGAGGQEIMSKRIEELLAESN